MYLLILQRSLLQPLTNNVFILTCVSQPCLIKLEISVRMQQCPLLQKNMVTKPILFGIAKKLFKYIVDLYLGPAVYKTSTVLPNSFWRNGQDRINLRKCKTIKWQLVTKPPLLDGSEKIKKKTLSLLNVCRAICV